MNHMAETAQRGTIAHMQRPARIERGGSDTVTWESVTTPPRAELHNVLRQYSEFRERSDVPIDRCEPAGVDPVLIVEFDDPLLVSEAADRESPRTWQSFAAGASQAPTETLHAGTQHCVEVRFAPLGLYRLSGLSMHELTDRVVSLEDLFGREGRELPERLAAESDWSGRFSLLDSLFARAAADGPEPDNEVVHAWNRLRQTDGTAAIGAILSEIGWSRGRLAQRFREQVGLDPEGGSAGSAVRASGAAVDRAWPSIADVHCTIVRLLRPGAFQSGFPGLSRAVLPRNGSRRHTRRCQARVCSRKNEHSSKTRFLLAPTVGHINRIRRWRTTCPANPHSSKSVCPTPFAHRRFTPNSSAGPRIRWVTTGKPGWRRAGRVADCTPRTTTVASTYSLASLISRPRSQASANSVERPRIQALTSLASADSPFAAMTKACASAYISR